nr:Chain B, ALA-LYS-GLY-LEU-PHE-MET [Xenopus laevis]6TYX_C Chain C, LYS-GLY-LEU-PHE-MET [Xenopus laevis]6TYX_D Chain D, LYS-GLY-LEU-PHE-MET [Xenopus laevis]
RPPAGASKPKKKAKGLFM